MTMQEFRDVLLSVTDKVYHFEAFQDSTGQYIVWQETGGHSLYGSDKRQGTVKHIQVDFFTGNEFDPVLDQLLDTLEASGVAFGEPVTSYDTNTKGIRHIIECEVV